MLHSKVYMSQTKEQYRETWKKHKDKYNRQRRKKYKNDKKYRMSCLERSKIRHKKSYENSKNIVKEIVYNHYGNKCKCCSEPNRLFLTIDHVNNDGYLERKSGMVLYKLIIKNNFPEKFQILCWNCNLGKYLNNGICPHNV